MAPADRLVDLDLLRILRASAADVLDVLRATGDRPIHLSSEQRYSTQPPGK
jgi:hypothetical protein